MVHRNGNIYNAAGKKLKILKNGSVRIYINGKKHIWKAAKVVYEAFSEQKLTSGQLLIFKDNNPNNIAFDNIDVIARKDYFKDHDWSDLFALSEKEIEEILKIKNKGKTNPMTGERQEYSCRELATKFNVSKSTMYKVLRGTYKKG